MNVLIFSNSLSLGGAEKAACRWAQGLLQRGHQVSFVSLADGPRRVELESFQIPVAIAHEGVAKLASLLREASPEVIHTHTPGYAHPGDILGEALKLQPKKIPVVQTNIFGRMNNPLEDQWTDLRLFISWTSCVQAVRRAFKKLDEKFFERASVVSYPLDPVEPPTAANIAAFRHNYGVGEKEILFGRLSRPEPNKWTNLALQAFRLALRRNGNIKLLLREPPPAITAELRSAPDADRFVILPATLEAEELSLTLSALQVILHTSSIGESFGYGIAEPMNLGKPVITHSVPWQDQAQIELVRPGVGGFVASTPATMAEAMIKLANDGNLCQKMGRQAQGHIRTLAALETSLDRLETILKAAIGQRPNPFASEDLGQALAVANYLDKHQFGHTWQEQLALRPLYYRVRFHEFRQTITAFSQLTNI